MSKLFEGFDWKNGQLSKAQLTYIDVFAQNQTEIYLSGDTDEQKAEHHLKRLYKQLGKKEPTIVWHDSPKGMIRSVDDSVDDSVRDSVWTSVWDSVGDSVRTSVWDSVRTSVRDSVREVWDSVWTSVWDSVGDSVGDSVRTSVRSWESAAWSSYYKFFSEELGANALIDWCLYSEQVTGGVLGDTEAHPVKKPIRLVRDADGRLHYDHDKAIEWADGFGFYYLRGVEFAKKTWQKIVEEKFTIKDLSDGGLSADQRAVAIQMLRADRLLEQVGAKLIDTGKRGVELYKVENFADKIGLQGDNDTEYCLRLKHPSIDGKEYIEWQHPDVAKKGSADECMAATRGLTVEQYLEAHLA